MEDVLATTMCIVKQTLNGKPMTPVTSDVIDLEAVTPNYFLLCFKNVGQPHLIGTEDFIDHNKQFRPTQAYADLIW